MVGSASDQRSSTPECVWPDEVCAGEYIKVKLCWCGVLMPKVMSGKATASLLHTASPIHIHTRALAASSKQNA
jgi:hypothetical protein